MESILRIEINVICVAILLVLLFNTQKKVKLMLDERLFKILLYSAIASVLLDMLSWIFNGGTYTGARELLILVNVLYYMTCVFVPYLWFLYVRFRLTEDEGIIRRNRFISALPMLFFFVLILLTPYTKWIFYVDENNIYHRGELYLVQIVISFFYMIYPTVFALVQASKCKQQLKKRECYSLAVFIIAPMLGAFIQVFFYGVQMISISIVFSIFLVYLSVQNRQMSLDALTRVNNRGQLDRYINVRIKNPSKDSMLYMIILDIDKFKGINDEFGHQAGDSALIDTVGILRSICDKNQAFLARYGGDEFAIILEADDEQIVLDMIHEIKSEVEKFNQTRGRSYKIALSIGYARYGRENIVTADALIEAADKSMYKEKHAVLDEAIRA